MDIYTNPPKNTYVTGITKLFMMPTDSGGIPAVAVTKTTSAYISSTYTILMILIFMVAWNLIITILMAFWPTNGDPNRETALVALWNSGESMNAAVLMGSYCKGMIAYILGRKKARANSNGTTPNMPVMGEVNTDEGPEISSGGKSTSANVQRDLEKQDGAPEDSSTSSGVSGVGNLWWGILFLLIASAMTAGNILSGILVPVQLSMGNVVPPAKDAIFYPDVKFYARTDDNGASLAKLNSLKPPLALRALGSIEASDVTVRSRVNLSRISPPNSQIASRWVGLNYNYEVTGVDMGLQSDPKLALRVRGSCHTEETWLVNSTDQGDSYTLFGDKAYTVKRQVGVGLPPMLDFALDERALVTASSNVSYAMIINTAGQYSYTSGQDPWYATQKSPANAAITYQVAPGRPPLSCWETRTWHLNGKEVESVKLATLPGLKLHKLWAETVLPLEFALPRIVTLGKAAGAYALKSASHAIAPDFILDAGSSGILEDLERLVLASWVSSRNVLRDTTTYGDVNMVNLAKGPGGSVEASAAKFVLQSGDVDTLSVRILVSVPVLLIFLFLVQIIFGCVLRRSNIRRESIFPKEGKNGISLQAAQLYRALYETTHHAREWGYKKSLIPVLFPPGSRESGSGTGTGPNHGEIETQRQDDPKTP